MSVRGRAERARQMAQWALDPAEPDAARQRWQSLDLGTQMQLADALAKARQPDLVRRYRGLLQVSAGLRRRRDASGTELLEREACLVLLVRRKRAPDALARQPAQRLPAELQTPAWVDGRYRLVAVPTDVQVQGRLLGARAQSAHGVHVGADASFGARGALTCALATASDPTRPTFVLAPLHVLTVLPPLDDRGIEAGGQVFALHHPTPPYDTKPMLQATRHGARLVPAPALSLDAQFARVRDATRTAQALSHLQLSADPSWVPDLAALGHAIAQGAWLEIVVPANHLARRAAQAPPVAATVSLTELDIAMPYVFADGEHLTRHRVMELQWRFADDRTLPGDSGSPVLLRHDDGTCRLAGMHIGADVQRRVSYMVPAWALFDRERYEELGGDLPDDIVMRPLGAP